MHYPVTNGSDRPGRLLALQGVEYERDCGIVGWEVSVGLADPTQGTIRLQATASRGNAVRDNRAGFPELGFCSNTPTFRLEPELTARMRRFESAVTVETRRFPRCEATEAAEIRRIRTPRIRGCLRVGARVCAQTLQPQAQ